MPHKRKMKDSTAILCGFKKVDGRQYFGDFSNREQAPYAPLAVCVLGARNLCVTGDPNRGGSYVGKFTRKFRNAWGFFPHDLNDGTTYIPGDDDMPGMPWEHIYGMARAAGL